MAIPTKASGHQPHGGSGAATSAPAPTAAAPAAPGHGGSGGRNGLGGACRWTAIGRALAQVPASLAKTT